MRSISSFSRVSSEGSLKSRDSRVELPDVEDVSSGGMIIGAISVEGTEHCVLEEGWDKDPPGCFVDIGSK